MTPLPLSTRAAFYGCYLPSVRKHYCKPYAVPDPLTDPHLSKDDSSRGISLGRRRALGRPIGAVRCPGGAPYRSGGRSGRHPGRASSIGRALRRQPRRYPRTREHICNAMVSASPRTLIKAAEAKLRLALTAWLKPKRTMPKVSPAFWMTSCSNMLRTTTMVRSVRFEDIVISSKPTRGRLLNA